MDCPLYLGVGQVGPEAKKQIQVQVSRVDGRDPNTWAIIASFYGV